MLPLSERWFPFRFRFRGERHDAAEVLRGHPAL